jgi:hypothetical protein
MYNLLNGGKRYRYLTVKKKNCESNKNIKVENFKEARKFTFKEARKFTIRIFFWRASGVGTFLWGRILWDSWLDPVNGQPVGSQRGTLHTQVQQLASRPTQYCTGLSYKTNADDRVNRRLVLTV